MVLSTAASQQEGPWLEPRAESEPEGLLVQAEEGLLTATSLHVLPVEVWVFTGFLTFMKTCIKG